MKKDFVLSRPASSGSPYHIGGITGSQIGARHAPLSGATLNFKKK